METMLHLGGLALATLFALIAAAALDWLFLLAMFRLMRPASARRPQVRRSDFVNATRNLSRQFAAMPKL